MLVDQWKKVMSIPVCGRGKGKVVDAGYVGLYLLALRCGVLEVLVDQPREPPLGAKDLVTTAKGSDVWFGGI
jgi:hypothetical protein